ncbi:hypothetical protein LPJ53_005383 [Coemansia erecta]|uniref:Uncharacterized protein n=1 Tax=Coemansia erecta TaxID=147472 RepID=A0A9W7XWZ7_9FUNG|nr:hypothetical protein LPJ53_005383 [Coemansia erecta]
MSTAASDQQHQIEQQQAIRLYELEATTAELRATNQQSQKTVERLERDHQHTLDELEALHKTHSRLEAQYFAGETELTTLRTKLERAQRTTLALERSLDAASTSAEREREAWQKRETELGNELAAAKRKATVQRRQTVSATPTPSHVRSTSMYAHDLPVPHLVSPLMAARTLARDPLPPSEPSGGLSEEDQMHVQVRQLTRRLRESEARAQLAAQQTAALQTEAHQAAGQLESMQRKVERLEHAARQLRELNESLREDNESYQVLVHMSTMKGGFALNNARTSLDSRTSSSNNVAAEAGAEANSSFASDEPLSAGLDLASELGQVLAMDPGAAHVPGDSESLGRHGLPAQLAELEEQNTQLKETLRKTKYERRQLGEENKALSLYVNKILGRILSSSDGLEAVLSRDYDPKQNPLTTFSTPAQPPRPRNPAASPAPPAAQTLSPVSNRSSVSSASRRPPPITAFSFAAPGSGDGITSVFVPPMSPTAPGRSLLPGEGQKVDEPQSPPPYTRRVRSATVAVASGDARAADPASPTKPAAASATIGNAAGSGTWWKRMSVLRLGSAWSPPEDPHAE